LSTIGFIEKPEETSKFIDKIKLIRPDIALLVFEKYCESETEMEHTKIALNKILAGVAKSVEPRIAVTTSFASNYKRFNDNPVDLGFQGKRVHKMLDNIDRK